MRDILDLDRYPIDQQGSDAYLALVKACQSDLGRDGMFNLDGFLRPEIAEALSAELGPRFANEAFIHARDHNIYFKKDIHGLAADHPALKTVKTINHTLCADQFEESDLYRVYTYAPLAAFIADVMGKPALYPMDDMLACCNAMAYHDGEALNWHFDRSEFTVTLLLQKPDIGGDFEYRKDLRSDTDPNYDGVAKMLNGNDPEVKLLAVTAGTLNVFKGKNTAHRVTPVKGPKQRIISVLCYYEQPGAKFTAEEQLGFYGRTF